MISREKCIFTFGYSGASLVELKWLAERFDSTVIDTRLSRRTRKIGFAVKQLAATLKDYYVHFPEFGNVNYKKGGKIRLADPERGIAKAASILKSRSVILLCVCALPDRCHRSVVAELLSKEFALPVRHLTRDDTA